MSPDQIEIFIQRFDAMLNQQDFGIGNEILARHFSSHVPIMPTLNRAGFIKFIESFYMSFPDFRQDIHEKIIADNRIVLRVTYYGTQQGDFLGIPATGCPIKLPAMIIFRIDEGLIVESWMEMDIFGVLRQISDGQSLAAKQYVQSIN